MAVHHDADDLVAERQGVGLADDALNCGKCGNVCKSGEICRDSSCVKDDNNTIIKEEDLDQKDVNDICKKLFVFRNVIMGKDYFGDVYNCFGNAYNFKNKELKDIDVLNSDKYLDIMTIAISYNKATIFNDIEKFVF